MPALNFQERFAELVASGEKRQTIRRKRKRPIKPGDMLYFYTGQRTKRCRYLGKAICTGVHRIVVWEGVIETPDGYDRNLTACDIARRDGFKDFYEMRAWFQKRYGLPFEGVLIEW